MKPVEQMTCEEWEDEVCYRCDGDGYIVADCFEDTCCCADPELEHDLIVCPVCGIGELKSRRLAQSAG